MERTAYVAFYCMCRCDVNPMPSWGRLKLTGSCGMLPPAMNDKPDQEEWQQDVRKVARGLKRRIQEAGLTFGEVERRAGMGRDYLRQVLRGTLKLRMEHVAKVLRVLDLSPTDFFVEVFGPPPSPLYDKPEHHTYATTVRVLHRSLLRRMIWKLKEKGVFSEEEARQMLAELEREIPLAERDVWKEK